MESKAWEQYPGKWGEIGPNMLIKGLVSRPMAFGSHRAGFTSLG
jgi:hypothetical protein